LTNLSGGTIGFGMPFASLACRQSKGDPILFRIVAAILALAAFAPNAAARPMDIGGPTSSPIGHFEFCKKWRDECARIAKPSGPEALGEAAWAAVRQINEHINSEIAPKTDREGRALDVSQGRRRLRGLRAAQAPHPDRETGPFAFERTFDGREETKR
jgi:hypothetical protein